MNASLIPCVVVASYYILKSFQDSMEHDVDLTADAYVIVYSVIDRQTFDAAVQNLYKLRHGLGSDRPIVLVGNKIDLVRKRKVKKDGKSILSYYFVNPKRS